MLQVLDGAHSHSVCVPIGTEPETGTGPHQETHGTSDGSVSNSTRREAQESLRPSACQATGEITGCAPAQSACAQGQPDTHTSPTALQRTRAMREVLEQALQDDSGKLTAEQRAHTQELLVSIRHAERIEEEKESNSLVREAIRKDGDDILAGKDPSRTDSALKSHREFIAAQEAALAEMKKRGDTTESRQLETDLAHWREQHDHLQAARDMTLMRSHYARAQAISRDSNCSSGETSTTHLHEAIGLGEKLVQNRNLPESDRLRIAAFTSGMSLELAARACASDAPSNAREGRITGHMNRAHRVYALLEGAQPPELSTGAKETIQMQWRLAESERNRMLAQSCARDENHAWRHHYLCKALAALGPHTHADSHGGSSAATSYDKLPPAIRRRAADLLQQCAEAALDADKGGDAKAHTDLLRQIGMRSADQALLVRADTLEAQAQFQRHPGSKQAMELALRTAERAQRLQNEAQAQAEDIEERLSREHDPQTKQRLEQDLRTAREREQSLSQAGLHNEAVRHRVHSMLGAQGDRWHQEQLHILNERAIQHDEAAIQSLQKKSKEIEQALASTGMSSDEREALESERAGLDAQARALRRSGASLLVNEAIVLVTAKEPKRAEALVQRLGREYGDLEEARNLASEFQDKYHHPDKFSAAAKEFFDVLQSEHWAVAAGVPLACGATGAAIGAFGGPVGVGLGFAVGSVVGLISVKTANLCMGWGRIRAAYDTGLTNTSNTGTAGNMLMTGLDVASVALPGMGALKAAKGLKVVVPVLGREMVEEAGKELLKELPGIAVNEAGNLARLSAIAEATREMLRAQAAVGIAGLATLPANIGLQVYDIESSDMTAQQKADAYRQFAAQMGRTLLVSYLSGKLEGAMVNGKIEPAKLQRFLDENKHLQDRFEAEALRAMELATGRSLGSQGSSPHSVHIGEAQGTIRNSANGDVQYASTPQLLREMYVTARIEELRNRSTGVSTDADLEIQARHESSDVVAYFDRRTGKIVSLDPQSALTREQQIAIGSYLAHEDIHRRNGGDHSRDAEIAAYTAQAQYLNRNGFELDLQSGGYVIRKVRDGEQPRATTPEEIAAHVDANYSRRELEADALLAAAKAPELSSAEKKRVEEMCAVLNIDATLSHQISAALRRSPPEERPRLLDTIEGLALDGKWDDVRALVKKPVGNAPAIDYHMYRRVAGPDEALATTNQQPPDYIRNKQEFSRRAHPSTRDPEGQRLEFLHLVPDEDALVAVLRGNTPIEIPKNPDRLKVKLETNLRMGDPPSRVAQGAIEWKGEEVAGTGRNIEYRVRYHTNHRRNGDGPSMIVHRTVPLTNGKSMEQFLLNAQSPGFEKMLESLPPDMRSGIHRDASGNYWMDGDLREQARGWLSTEGRMVATKTEKDFALWALDNTHFYITPPGWSGV